MAHLDVERAAPSHHNAVEAARGVPRQHVPDVCDDDALEGCLRRGRQVPLPCLQCGWRWWWGRGSSSDDDLEMGTTRNGEERYPLLSSQSSSMSGGSTIRGRVPLINTMESDLGDAGDVVANEEVPAVSTPRFGASLSRRAPLSGSGI